MCPTKDRWGIVSDRARDGLGLMPMDLGAILRVGLSREAGAEGAEADWAILRAFGKREKVSADAMVEV